MTPTERDYFLSAIASAQVDQLPHSAQFIAASIATTGEEFDAAIQAATRLEEIRHGHSIFQRGQH